MVLTHVGFNGLYAFILGGGTFIILLLFVSQEFAGPSKAGPLVLAGFLLTLFAMLTYHGVVLYRASLATLPVPVSDALPWVGGAFGLLAVVALVARTYRGVLLLFGAFGLLSLGVGVFGSIGLAGTTEALVAQYLFHYLASAIIVSLGLIALFNVVL